jgi:selenocysteine-specific elongation factor
LPSGATIGFVDVPGHVRYLSNMLAGVGAIDACLFVVAATEGWKPQSEEHLRILQLVGLRHGVIALTKVDLVDDEWRALQALDVIDRVAGTFLEGAPIVGVSATTAEGIDELSDELDRLLVRMPLTADRGRPRLWIDRSFAAKGSGTVVTGTLTGGSLHIDQHIDIVPSARSARIRSIQQHGAAVERMGPGSRVALNLSGVDHHEVRRGDAVVSLAQWRPTQRFDASLDVLAALDHTVSRRGAFLAHIGSGEWSVTLRVLGPDHIEPGASGLVRLQLPVSLPLLPGDRFVLRESGRDETVGGGEVLDVAPVLPASKARPDRDIDRVIAERGWIDLGELEALTGQRVAPTVGRWVASPTAIEATVRSLRTRVRGAGALGIDVAGLDDHERAVAGTLPDLVFDGARLVSAMIRDDIADHPVVAELQRGGLAPSVPVGVDRATLRELIRRGVLVERDGIHFHRDAVEIAARTAAALLSVHPGGITMAQLRDALGVSRKFALPLANELDARGVTRRRDDLRIAGPRLPDV